VDPVRDLNNYLQGHPRGNLTIYFSWVMKQSGPGHQVTHTAVANCESFDRIKNYALSYAVNGTEIGSGRSFSMGNAKREAAMQALQYFSVNKI
jgi:dsRNA-specific ribonuclease